MGLMLTRTDRLALKASLTAARTEDAGRARQIDGMLADGRAWSEVAKFASYCAQADALHLQPWEFPPVWINDLDQALNATPDDARHIRNAALLLQRMLAAGISRWHPDPVAACEAAEPASGLA